MGPALLKSPILEAVWPGEPREEFGSFLRVLSPANRRDWEAQAAGVGE